MRTVEFPTFKKGHRYQVMGRLDEIGAEKLAYIVIESATEKTVKYRLFHDGKKGMPHNGEVLYTKRLRWSKNPRTGNYEDAITLLGRGVPVFARDEMRDAE